ncbi:hypothetical protein cypCar_00048452 [Cyprinus carpio]|nr:hypothetical protein cypCar_00048452 [Cyprinus carpio]
MLVLMLMNIKKRHLVVHEDDSAVTKSLKTTLTEETDRRWELKDRLLESSIYIKAAVLDPRFKKFSFFTDERRYEVYTVVENLTESLAARPVQEVGEDSDLVEQCDPAGPSEQKEKNQVVSMLLSSDEEEQPPEESEMRTSLKDTTKSNTGPLYCKRTRRDTQSCPEPQKGSTASHLPQHHQKGYSPRLDLSSMRKFIMKLFARFMKPLTLQGRQVHDILYMDPLNQPPGEKLNIGFTTRATLNRLLEAGDTTPREVQLFQQAALAFLVRAVEYGIKNSP